MKSKPTYKETLLLRKAIRRSVPVFIMGIGVLLPVFLWLIRPMPDPYGNVLSDRSYYIAHAAGAIDGYRYTNCREALLQTINNGYKYIELDLGLTKDSVLVCLHDWKLFNSMTSYDNLNEQSVTASEFKKRKIYNKFTPLTIKDVIAIQNKYQFVIVTDRISKVEILNKYFTQNKNNIMVEAFTATDYIMLKEAGYIPMLSLQTINYPKIIKYFLLTPLIKRQKIDWICIKANSNMKSIRLIKRLFNCKIAMYTSNSPSFFKEHLGKEIDLVYTDVTTSH